MLTSVLKDEQQCLHRELKAAESLTKFDYLQIRENVRIGCPDEYLLTSGISGRAHQVGEAKVVCLRLSRRALRDSEASVLMHRLSYPTETVLSNKITRNRIVLSFKDRPRRPLGRRPEGRGEGKGADVQESHHSFFALFFIIRSTLSRRTTRRVSAFTHEKIRVGNLRFRSRF